MKNHSDVFLHFRRFLLKSQIQNYSILYCEYYRELKKEKEYFLIAMLDGFKHEKKDLKKLVSNCFERTTT